LLSSIINLKESCSAYLEGLVPMKMKIV